MLSMFLYRVVPFMLLFSTLPWLKEGIFDLMFVAFGPLLIGLLVYVLHNNDKSTFRVSVEFKHKLILVLFVFVAIHASIGVVLHNGEWAIDNMTALAYTSLLLLIASSVTLPFVIANMINSDNQINYQVRVFDKVFTTICGAAMLSSILFIVFNYQGKLSWI